MGGKGLKIKRKRAGMVVSKELAPDHISAGESQRNETV
jgi:hypothetical protein